MLGHYGFVFGIISLSLVAGRNGGFRKVALDAHNMYRSLMNSAPLKLSSELNIAAHAEAEKLAAAGTFESSGNDYRDQENIWAHFGELRPLSENTKDATVTWYTGTPIPEHTIYRINQKVLYSNTTRYLGIGAGTGEAYTVVIAYYL